MIRKAIIPAAGLGTRFLPATKAMPKEMLPILDKPTIQYIVEEAAAAGIEDILIVTGKHKRAIEDHFDNQTELEMTLLEKSKLDLLEKVKASTDLANIFFVRQKNPRGLGHAIATARSFIGNEPFAVLLGDDIIQADVPGVKQLIDEYSVCKSSILGVTEIIDEEVHKYGIVETIKQEGSLYEVDKLLEKPSLSETNSRLGIIGRYILTPEIFDELEKEVIGAGGEIQLTDAIDMLNKRQNVYAKNIEGTRYDVGEKFGFVKANVDFALNSEIKDQIFDYLESLKKKG
ncbi:UTP--glucose-1-phosphate uridylyltransferase GalU [Macrococcoides caseolyticum]|uniref:UTP--glucose-1-phosphate uridylyltransferase n=1 Tax=Macrococcoides caseolyticum TaxID=69966 RepID=A0ACC9MUS7_9STAP|nr:UTP--glucose-1-phosphate uridylyltransferase GalU [Macrococcus caseolyticus]PKE20292.1 UTP--glucose-1-phosphate uridylyltransferase [Macrococcus caseolyticus]PKE40261.1 UTP--glucose-1-phosphate uridylyltransferase [Macrococcus caseolyticus]PKE57429.1 UTP--glucose-1-phosphate uridylyltransferase [Macrococcus caseolyticus]PKF41246.1 UTP--glucose-1-phosphate uridylyltransferase [Macrococcus caseolyticus]QQB05551.1 UTP--glucose-1-phosphate uridylyltransferase GalU [Macrococcus caseolyticus]